jgi:hypothetical protein
MAYTSIAIVPPPWSLQGDGLVLIYRFSPQFVAEQAFVTPDMGEYRGGLGAVMLVDYTESGVGPYRELLFVPGRFRIGKVRAHSISKIYVSTESSVVNGRANWGIPKEHADFHRTHVGDVQGWNISINGGDFLRVSYTPGRIAFRVWTFPFFAPLVQHLDGQTFVTRIRASGVCKLATVNNFEIDPAFFPDVSSIEPIGIIRVTTFKMTFPQPRMVEA